MGNKNWGYRIKRFAPFDCLVWFLLCVDWLLLFIMGISSNLCFWSDEDVGESFFRRGLVPLVCYLISDCYLGVSIWLHFTHIETLKLWICHTKNFTTVVPLSLFCGILCWHDWPWKNIHCCVYRCLPLLHRPTVYLCLTKVSGDITIRNCRTSEPSINVG